LIVICSLILAFIISRKIVNPLNQVNKVIKSALDGDFNQRVYADDFKEIENLSKNLNDMIYNIDKKITSLNNENEELKSIFASIKEAIIVINNDGLIIRSNKSFLDLFEIKSANSKYYWEIIKESEIINYIKNEENKEDNVLKEFLLKNKNLLCSINYLEEKRFYVLIFYDITTLKNLENIKKDFISNASHELHTPLAAIKGFTETLMDSEKDTEKLKYLDIIRRNTERLIHIVKDLLVLSKLEAANSEKNNININIEKISIDTFLKSLVDMFEKNLKEKKIRFTYKILDRLKTIDGDFFKLEEMFINLIDNAIKYTDKGEIKIIISDLNEKNSIKIEVIDTGIGIPEKDLTRIFERFYVVDKSRSKISGGTGLGLSIVKHVVMLHKGDIKVSSRLGEGSNFTIILPKIKNV
jgi:two-component system phosphate regulon sensor histidine kinase PhoR